MFCRCKTHICPSSSSAVQLYTHIVPNSFIHPLHPEVGFADSMTFYIIINEPLKSEFQVLSISNTENDALLNSHLKNVVPTVLCNLYISGFYAFTYKLSHSVLSYTGMGNDNTSSKYV